jgi:hypothetical protein
LRISDKCGRSRNPFYLKGLIGGPSGTRTPNLLIKRVAVSDDDNLPKPRENPGIKGK